MLHFQILSLKYTKRWCKGTGKFCYEIFSQLSKTTCNHGSKSDPSEI